MANTMANIENLTPFTTEYQPETRRTRAGIPNTSTVIKKYVETKIKTLNPLTNELEQMTLVDAIAFAVIAHQQTNK